MSSESAFRAAFNVAAFAATLVLLLDLPGEVLWYAAGWIAGIAHLDRRRAKRELTMNSLHPLLHGHRPRKFYSDERVPINIAPEVRDRLNGLLYSPAFMGTGVGFSAFIDRACEAAETAYAEQLTAERQG